MAMPDFAFLHDGKRHVISLVGGGGKTTVMYELAAYFAGLGRTVLVMTTTHIWQPDKNFAPDLAAARQLWRAGNYAVAGREEPGTGKLTQPDSGALAEYLQAADIALIEADGAKGLPCKLPAAHEPVILPASDVVLGVFGLDALGKTLKQCCLRYELAQQVFGWEENQPLTAAMAVRLLLSEQGTRKGAGGRSYYVVLNKCDDEASLAEALKLRQLLAQQGLPQEHIWLRGKR